MSDEMYAPPVARVADATEAATNEFYVVAQRKFVLLYLATFGYYSIYWFYQNWSLYKIRRKADVWPVPRSIFQIFFVHQLFENIDASLRRTGQRYVWNAGTQATAYVILVIISRLVDRFAETNSGPVLALILAGSFVTVLPLLAAQRAINLAEGDPDGKSNASLSGANIAWMIVGGLLWVIVLLGLTMLVFNPEAVNE